MTYAEMRALFARLTGDEGQFAVVLAYGEARAGRDGVAIAWTVVARDDARPPLPGTAVRALYHLTGAADLARLEEGRDADGLCGLEDDEDGEDDEDRRRSERAYTLTWREVLRALDRIHARTPGWTVERIVGTPAREPRYCLFVRAAGGPARPVPSYDAVDRLYLEAGPLAGPRPRPRPRDEAYADALRSRGRGADPVTAWTLQPGRRPAPCTTGELPVVAVAGAACVWVDLCAPDADDLRAVARALGLPYRAALATLSPDGQPHVVPYRDYVALRVAVARREPVAGAVVADPLDMIVGRNVLVTVHGRPQPALQRARLRGATSGDDAASALAGVVLTEILTSEEALARWVAREADAHAAGAPGAAEPRAHVAVALRTRRAATALRRLAERRSCALAVARAEAESGRASPAPPIPSLDYLLAREARLVAALQTTERTADGAVRLLVARATWRERARRVALLRLVYVFAAAAVAGLARLTLSGAHLAGLALGAATLVCFLIAGAGGAVAARAGDASGARAERRARAAWGNEDDEGEFG